MIKVFAFVALATLVEASGDAIIRISYFRKIKGRHWIDLGRAKSSFGG